LFAAILAACSRPPVEAPADTFDRRAMLASVGEHVILPTYREFKKSAEALEGAASAHATAVAAGTLSSERSAARDSWKQAMIVWQRAELFQLGPAGSPRVMTGGKNLRDQIYSWPTLNTCRVDQEVVDARFRDPGFFETALVNAYGLAALEYLLFNESPSNTCPPEAIINISGAWAALADSERTRRRADYAAAAAAHLAKKSRELLNEWEPSAGNFLGQLATAGEAGSVYRSAQAAVDELFAAMFYLDLRVKDRKLAVPAGISVLCPAATCPEALESRWAKHSGLNIVANLKAFQAVFAGNVEGDEPRPSFDDFLADRGAAELAETIYRDTQAVADSVVALPGGIEAAVAADPAAVRAIHAALKTVTDAMKSQMVTVLNLSVPNEGAADND
jgi:predicted lipoprotein